MYDFVPESSVKEDMSVVLCICKHNTKFLMITNLYCKLLGDFFDMKFRIQYFLKRLLLQLHPSLCSCVKS